jgi:PAS domain S-box-containing protein
MSDSTERLVRPFAHSLSIGFAVLDHELRYQAVNSCLAAINGVPAKAHLGLSTREMFGELSEKIAEPGYHRILAHGEIEHFEIRDSVLPSRPGSRYWGLNVCFPIRDRTGNVRQIGTMVVEVTQQRELEKLLGQLAGTLRSSKTRESFWFAREVQDAVEQYHAALALSLDHLVGKREISTDSLAESIEELDRHIMAMNTLVSSVITALPIR